MLGIKKGDTVVVRVGKDKGVKGKVLRVFRREGRAIVEGANLVKKHMRRRSEQEAGGIIEKPAPLALSNLALYCSNCRRGVRFGVKIMKDNSKVRICKRCQSPL